VNISAGLSGTRSLMKGAENRVGEVGGWRGVGSGVVARRELFDALFDELQSH
jgi:hypothetical protein